MLCRYLPERPAAFDLPDSETFSRKVSESMIAAGLEPGFLDDIAEAFRAASTNPPIGIRDVAGLEGLIAIPGLIETDGNLIRAPVRLWDVIAPTRLAGAVANLGGEGIVFIDQQVSIASGFEALTARVLQWLLIGAVAGTLFLFVAIRRPADIAEIALGCLAAGLVTALLAGIPSGGIGAFHIVALTLVVGIGIDYGIFLTLSDSEEQYQEALRSVLICAATTLIAFLTMVFSGVSLLEEIGTTVWPGLG
jgi:predicted exporter